MQSRRVSSLDTLDPLYRPEQAALAYLGRVTVGYVVLG